MYLAKNLKYLRLRDNLTQEELAEFFGYKSYTTIQKWESGVSEPSIGMLSKLAERYGVDLDEMVSVDLEERNNYGSTDIRFAAKMANGFNLNDLTEDDIAEIRRFIEFKKAQNKDRGDESGKRH